MALLGAVAYDPTGGATVTKSTAALLAMTAVDTTNCRITFTAPANGNVLVRLRCGIKGGGGSPMILLGVIENSPSAGTLRGRFAPTATKLGASGGQLLVREVSYAITGLTPNQSYTWDAAYAVQVVFASTNIVYGGPDNATTNDAAGAFVFEVWEATNLLAGTIYDPSTAAAKSTATLQAMTAFDTTNLRLTFTCPASGKVLVKMQAGAGWTVTGTSPVTLLGVIENSPSAGTVRGRVGAANIPTQTGSGLATDLFPLYASFPVTGLTPSQSYTWDAAFGLEQVLAASFIHYGGPDDAAGADAWGGFAYEIWSA